MPALSTTPLPDARTCDPSGTAKSIPVCTSSLGVPAAMPRVRYDGTDSGPLSQKITRNGVTVDVHIFRGDNDPVWILEVVDQEGGSTVWEDTFETEQDALNEVFQTIASEGIACFLRDPIEKLH